VLSGAIFLAEPRGPVFAPPSIDGVVRITAFIDYRLDRRALRQDLIEKAVRFFGRGRRRSEQNPIHDGRDDALQQELDRRR
jgi:hypothetical protein